MTRAHDAQPAGTRPTLPAPPTRPPRALEQVVYAELGELIVIEGAIQATADDARRATDATTRGGYEGALASLHGDLVAHDTALGDAIGEMAPQARGAFVRRLTRRLTGLAGLPIEVVAAIARVPVETLTAGADPMEVPREVVQSAAPRRDFTELAQAYESRGAGDTEPSGG